MQREQYDDRSKFLDRIWTSWLEKKWPKKEKKEKRVVPDIIGRLTNRELCEMLMSYYVTFVYRGQRKGSKRRKEREEEKSVRRLKMAWHGIPSSHGYRLQSLYRSATLTGRDFALLTDHRYPV